MLLRLLVPLVLCVAAAAAGYAPAKAPEIDREAGWCDGGMLTKTTGECMCKTHKGFFCTGPKCQNAQGFSFFQWECLECSCALRAGGGDDTVKYAGAGGA